MLRKNKQGLTLVELIIVITILTLLATIGFVSYSNYVKDGRDVQRVSDIENIKEGLNLNKLNTGNFVLPGDSTNIVYSGATVWSQGTMSEEIISKLGNLNGDFLDPLTQTPYTYSVTKDKKEYQIGSILEGSITSGFDFGNKYYANVVGNYNGVIIKAKIGTTTYIFAIPSILTNDLSNPDILDIIANNKLVYNGYDNLPPNYGVDGMTLSGTFDCNGNPLIYSGNGNDLLDYNNILQLAENIQDFYNECESKNEYPYNEIVEANINSKTEVNEKIVGPVLDILDINEDNIVIPPNSPPIGSDITLTFDENIDGTGSLDDFIDSDPISYSISGTLPSGLTYQEIGGVKTISGMPTQDGDFVLTYSASDGENTTDVNLTIKVNPDLWTWNSEHTLACKRNSLSKIECKWKTFDDMDTSKPVAIWVNGFNCEPLSTNLENGPTILEKNVTPWCEGDFTSNENVIQLVYQDTSDTYHTSSYTLDIPLNLITLESSYFTANATGFDFDLTSLPLEIDKDYIFGIAEASDQTSFSNCTEFYNSGNRIGRIDIEEDCGGTNFGIPIPDLDETIIVLRDKITKENYSNGINKMLGYFTIDSSYFTPVTDGIQFNLTNHPEIQDLLDASGYTIWVGGSNCTNRVTNPTKSGKIGDGGITCGRKFTPGVNWNFDLYLSYGSNGNTSFRSNTINLSFTN